jgi:hypothetical protein
MSMTWCLIEHRGSLYLYVENVFVTNHMLLYLGYGKERVSQCTDNSLWIYALFCKWQAAGINPKHHLRSPYSCTLDNQFCFLCRSLDVTSWPSDIPTFIQWLTNLWSENLKGRCNLGRSVLKWQDITMRCGLDLSGLGWGRVAGSVKGGKFNEKLNDC